MSELFAPAFFQFLTISAVLLSAIVVLIAAVLLYALVFPLQPHRSPVEPLPQHDQELAERLRGHVAAIASVPHNVAYYAELEKAAAAIEGRLTEFGFTPQAQEYMVDGGIPVRNIEAVIEPAKQQRSPPTYVIGAHYDSPDNCPGANDNGTGVAALLEIARALREHRPEHHRLRLQFFVNEEAPYCKTPDMGSWQAANRLKAQGENIKGMMALETLGYFSERPGSQDFPAPFNWVYPDKGNFVAFVGLPGARNITHTLTRKFRKLSGFPAIGGIAPGFIPGIDLSDHWAFNQFGFPALMVTDTAPFRNPYYHQLNDTPDNVDYENLARITRGLIRVIEDLTP